MYTLIDGKAVAANVKSRVRSEVESLTKNGIRPCLAVILVGSDPASQVYVRNKQRACEETGIESRMIAMPANITQAELLAQIDYLNQDSSVHGILCQLPLPSHISEKAVIERISPKKDVDCFNNENVGKIWSGEPMFKPCTPAGIIELLDAYSINVSGKNCVIIGRSNIVGKPMAALMQERNATVTICHSKTENLKEICLGADIIIAAVGKPNFVTADMVKPSAVVIDVGINRLPNGKLCGDVDFENVKEKASFITPVPGGCGPMTVAMLMQNTLTAVKAQYQNRNYQSSYQYTENNAYGTNYASQTNTAQTNTGYGAPYTPPNQAAGKRLYRSDIKVLAGVCGGIGEYLGVDPNIIRVIVAFCGFCTVGVPALLVYIIVACVIPKAPDGYSESLASTYKHIYKSQNKKLAGVCGGIAEYFGVDASMVRIIFVLLVLLFGTGLLFYIICAIIIPKRYTEAPPMQY